MLDLIAEQFKRPRGLLGRITSVLMRKNNSIIYEELLPELGITPQSAVLEIGYGHGIGIDRICSDFDCAVTGIDFSTLMNREAVKRNKRHIARKRAVLICGDYCGSDLGVECFDRAQLLYP